MFSITVDQIRAAQQNDLGAVTAIIAETNAFVVQEANSAASRRGEYSAERAEDLAQEGRIAAWEAVGAFKGDTVGEFVNYMTRTVRFAISQSAMSQEGHGVSRASMERFARALRKANGDADEAIRLCTSAEAGRERMSMDTARAARLATLQPAVSLESLTYAPTDDEPEPQDDAARSRQTGYQVRTVLGMLGATQRLVLSAMTGIGEVPEYGVSNDHEMSADYGLGVSTIQQARARGRVRFAALYEQTYGQVGSQSLAGQADA